MARRYPSGRAREDAREDPRFPTLWRRIKDHGTRIGIHPYMGTVLGRLSLLGILRDHQVEAGFRFAEIVGAYDRLCSGARPYTPASPAYERGLGSGGAGAGDSEAAIARLARAARRARRHYEQVIDCLPNAQAYSLLVDVCIKNEEVGQARHADLSALLSALADRLLISRPAAAAPAQEQPRQASPRPRPGPRREC
jgi:hypothetical protein